MECLLNSEYWRRNLVITHPAGVWFVATFAKVYARELTSSTSSSFPLVFTVVAGSPPLRLIIRIYASTREARLEYGVEGDPKSQPPLFPRSFSPAKKTTLLHGGVPSSCWLRRRRAAGMSREWIGLVPFAKIASTPAGI